ncbi:glycosyltransferase family 1 protein [Pedobacter sp. PLR]|uniref:glycosyltransferase family 4 protein n=1 Tax=Pedobacter sp. PLR TaxID=2994465 RepID=UPI002246D9A8|nr:glycosyltransferase family 1 protein [Pedobacter sp. PLR]MCX2453367.1 glycosyltransferase family 1 protein [Pedobacter sp. PLR]
MKYDSDVVYDANFAINKHRGMGKYINNFINVLNVNLGLRTIGLLKGGTKIVPSRDYHSFGFSLYILWEQLSMYFFSRKFKGVIIYPYNTASIFSRKSASNVLIVHDLIYFNDFETKSLKQRLGASYRRFVVPRVINKFEHIITVSEYSKKQLLNRFNLDGNKIEVIPNSIIFNLEEANHNPKYNQRDNYILHIGGEPEYKNSKSLLYAFSKLPDEVRKSYKVKMIGIRDKKVLNQYQSLAESLGISEAIEFLAYQTDEEIIQLYKNAKMFIFPSFDEGFGIPIIESFKFGCPLLCSNTSCFPEIAGNAARYFDPANYTSIASAIVSSIMEVEETEKNIEFGYDQVKKYSSDLFAEKIRFWFSESFDNI